MNGSKFSFEISLVAVTTLFLAGCAVGPNYVAPRVPQPPAWVNTENTGIDTGVEGLALWWETLGDTQLTDLVRRAVERNYDVRIAEARVREARALRGVAQADRLPQAQASGSGGVNRISENNPGVGSLARLGVVPVTTDIYQIGFDASWEIDIFGGKRRKVEAADARIQAAEYARRDVLVSVIAEVARNYIELRGAQRRLAVAENNVRIQSETLELVENKFLAGLVREIDVAQARSQLEQTRSTLPGLQVIIRASTHRLGVLIAEPPTALLETLLEVRPLPTQPDVVPIGLPSQLLRRRSDVRRAERELAAATADIGVAVARLFPRFLLTGTGGFKSGALSNILSAASGTLGFGPSIQWPIFQGGRNRARIRAFEARHDQELDRYQQAVLLALEDVETALVRYARQQDEYERLVEAQTSSSRAVDLARTLYELGLTDFLTVLDAERVLSGVDDRLVRSETAVIVRLVGLFKALGGGWERPAASVEQEADRGDLPGDHRVEADVVDGVHRMLANDPY